MLPYRPHATFLLFHCFHFGFCICKYPITCVCIHSVDDCRILRHYVVTYVGCEESFAQTSAWFLSAISSTLGARPKILPVVATWQSIYVLRSDRCLSVFCSLTHPFVSRFRFHVFDVDVSRECNCAFGFAISGFGHHHPDIELVSFCVLHSVLLFVVSGAVFILH